MSKGKAKNLSIIGNPNTGKTSIFNLLTGLKQKTGNWAGVTVDKKQGKFTTDNFNCTLTDLPGIYSLPYDNNQESTAVDEQIAVHALLRSQHDFDNKIDCIINIIDGSNLTRDLYLTTQLRDLNIPMIVIVNMIDVAKKTGIMIDCNVLSSQLKCPVVAISARKKTGIKNLKAQINNLLLKPQKNLANNLPWQISQLLTPIIRIINNKVLNNNNYNHAYWNAISICHNTNQNTTFLELNPEQSAQINQVIMQIQQSSSNNSLDMIIAQKRHQFINHCVTLSSKQCSKAKVLITDSLDRIFLNKFFRPTYFLNYYVLYV